MWEYVQGFSHWLRIHISRLATSPNVHEERTFTMMKQGHPTAASPLAGMPNPSTDPTPN
jgi:hypothetical protein